MMKVQLKVDGSLMGDLRLWRYLDFAKLISMFHTRSLWLARADTFKDRHEGRFPDEMRKLTEEAYESFPPDDPSPVKDADDFQDYLVRNTFINCWHKNDDESLAMWEIYGRNTEAVAIQTTVARIRASVDCLNLRGHSLQLRPVTYKNPEDVKGVLRYEDCFFRKRSHFDFEKEVRIALDTYFPKSPTKNTPFGYQFPCDLNTLVESIYVHPDSDDWVIDAARSVAKCYSVHVPVERGTSGNK
jgi:hypothetical protein